MQSSNQMDAADWRNASMKDKAKIAHGKFVEKCTDKVLRYSNYAAIGVLAFGLFMRLIYMFGSSEKGENYSGFWFFFMTLYYGVFLAMLVFAYHPDQENKHSLLVRVHFRMLDFDFGRGLWIFFISMIMNEVHDDGEVVYGIVTCLIAIANMILGFNEMKDNIKVAMGNGEVKGNDAMAMASDNNDDDDEDNGGQYGQVVNDSSRNSVGMDSDQKEDIVIDFEKEDRGSGQKADDVVQPQQVQIAIDDKDEEKSASQGESTASSAKQGAPQAVQAANNAAVEQLDDADDN